MTAAGIFRRCTTCSKVPWWTSTCWKGFCRRRRVSSVVVVHQPLDAWVAAAAGQIARYLSKLSESLGEPMIGETRPAKLTVTADQGWAVSAAAVSLGLIVTELVINALKYAF